LMSQLINNFIIMPSTPCLSQSARRGDWYLGRLDYPPRPACQQTKTQ